MIRRNTSGHRVVVVTGAATAIEVGVIHRIFGASDAEGAPLYSFAVIGQYVPDPARTPSLALLADAETVVLINPDPAHPLVLTEQLRASVVGSIRRGVRALSIGSAAHIVPPGDHRVIELPRLSDAIPVLLQLLETDHGPQAAHDVRQRLEHDGFRTSAAVLGDELPSIPREVPTGYEARLIGWVDANLGRDISLDEMARRIGVSRRSFQRNFRSAVGLSPHQWLLERRHKRCKHLLVATDLTQDTIAQQVGFGTASNLRRHFTRREGMTPGAYREQAHLVSFTTTDWTSASPEPARVASLGT